MTNRFSAVAWRRRVEEMRSAVIRDVNFNLGEDDNDSGGGDGNSYVTRVARAVIRDLDHISSRELVAESTTTIRTSMTRKNSLSHINTDSKFSRSTKKFKNV